MAFIKNELNYKQRTYRTFLDAQKIFEDFNMNEIQRMEALNYILNHQEISYVLDMLFEKYGENPDIDHYSLLIILFQILKWSLKRRWLSSDIKDDKIIKCIFKK